MIQIGNFFFKYRNVLFIVLYLMLFIPSPPLFSPGIFGPDYFVLPIGTGLFITIAGQAVRGLTIGLAYIIRGGKDGKVYAENLVTDGLFAHVRNPLYIGNILMLWGVGVLANSLLFTLIVTPVFVFIYQCIVLAEENFLRSKFGDGFERYKSSVNRWLPRLGNIGKTMASMSFRWKRWLTKEYNTQFIWLSGIALILLYKYPELTDSASQRGRLAVFSILGFTCYYLLIRYLKKTGKWSE